MKPLIFAPNFERTMGSKWMKSFLVATFSFFLLTFSTNLFAQENQETIQEREDAFDPTEMIMHHIQDAHSFHFFTYKDFHATIYLPVILYSPQKGFSVFSASKFGHEGELTYEGYKLENGNKIVPVEAGTTVYDFSLTRNVVQMFLVGILFIWAMFGVARKYKKGIGVKTGPKGFQNFMEIIIIFIRDNVAKANLGSRWERYMPLLLTIFFFILTNAMFGLIPGVANVPGNIAFTLTLGIVALIVILFSTTGHFWKHLFWPPGVPFFVKVILVPVELVGTLLIKPGALVIRLFANMIAGHIVILAFVGLIFIFGGMFTALGFGFSPLSMVFIIFDYFLEILIAFIQAFIFTVLTAIFIGQGFEGSEHDVHPGTHDGLL